MKKYNWQLPDWPHFSYDLTKLHTLLLEIAQKMGYIGGQLAHLVKDLQTEAMINFMVEEAVRTSEIEGEFISRIDIRSSIKNQLGLNQKHMPIYDKRAQGIAALMLDVRKSFKQTLTETKLFDWHLMLMSGSTNPHLRIASWRIAEDSMQIVSGHNGKWIVHFEAPSAQNVPDEMKKFIRWFNETAQGKPEAIPFAPIRAAIAHLYFESIHPFDDGNGRIGRAIAEKALSQGFGYPVLLSLSQVIESDKNAYYTALHKASKSNEITDWLSYFLNIVLKAQNEVEQQINFILQKSQFFDKFKNQFNEREMKVIKRMLREGVKGFEGGMSAKKYMAIVDTSKATATRDLQHLVSIKALLQHGSGPSVRYELNLNKS